MRVVDAYGYVQHQSNFYRVADEHIGTLVYLCVDVERLEVFDRGIHRLAEHQRLADGAGLRQGAPGRKRRRYDVTLLLERLAAWGEGAENFGHKLRQHKRYPGPALNHILGLQVTWSADDIVEALHHAQLYDAYDARAVERILEARFRPRSLEGQIAETTRSQIREAMREHPVRQRPLSDYATLRAGDPATPQLGDAADDEDREEPT